MFPHLQNVYQHHGFSQLLQHLWVHYQCEALHLWPGCLLWQDLPAEGLEEAQAGVLHGGGQGDEAEGTCGYQEDSCWNCHFC